MDDKYIAFRLMSLHTLYTLSCIPSRLSYIPAVSTTDPGLAGRRIRPKRRAPRARPPERSGDRGAPRAKTKGVRGGEAPRVWSGAAMKLFVDSGNIKDIETLAAI